MPDGSDPGRVEKYTDRQVERVRQTVHDPNRTDILKTIRKGRRGNIPSPKPNQRTKPSWSKATVRNNARDLRILAGQLQGFEEVTYEGTKWKGREGRDDYPDRLLDLSPEQVRNPLAELSIAGHFRHLRWRAVASPPVGTSRLPDRHERSSAGGSERSPEPSH